MTPIKRRWIGIAILLSLPLPLLYRTWWLWQGRPEASWLAELWAPFAIFSTGSVVCVDWMQGSAKGSKSVKIQTRKRAKSRREA